MLVPTENEEILAKDFVQTHVAVWSAEQCGISGPQKLMAMLIPSLIKKGMGWCVGGEREYCFRNEKICFS